MQTLEISLEIILVVISLMTLLSCGLVFLIKRSYLISKNQVSQDKVQSVIENYQTKIQELQSDFQESQITIQEHQTIIQKLQNQLKIKDKRSWQIGQNSANGGIAEFLGGLGLSIIQKFDTLCMLASTSKKPSADAIGFNDDGITFIEFKKSGATLTPKENKIKKLIAAGKVNYEIVDVNLPDNLTEIRKTKEKEVNLCHIQN